jgi:hypothetical protein
MVLTLRYIGTFLLKMCPITPDFGTDRTGTGCDGSPHMIQINAVARLQKKTGAWHRFPPSKWLQ